MTKNWTKQPGNMQKKAMTMATCFHCYITHLWLVLNGNGNKQPKQRVMSRNKDYQRLLNSKRWKELRAWKLQQNPLCEMCQAEGYVRAAVDVHHIIPVESAHTLQEMEQLAFDPSNLKALCIPCHVKTHKDMGKNKKENVIERKQISLQRWIQKNRPSNGGQ